MLGRFPRALPLAFALVLGVPLISEASDTVKRIQEDVKESRELTDRKRIEKDMKQKPGEGKMGCDTLAKETRRVCVDQILRGFMGNCYQSLVSLEMSARQSQGKLFDMKGRKGKDGKEISNQDVADASCRVHIRSIHRRYEKHADTLKPEGSAGLECTKLAQLMETACWPRLGTEDFPNTCKSSIQVMGFGPGGAEDKCKLGLSVLQR